MKTRPAIADSPRERGRVRELEQEMRALDAAIASSGMAPIERAVRSTTKLLEGAGIPRLHAEWQRLAVVSRTRFSPGTELGDCATVLLSRASKAKREGAMNRILRRAGIHEPASADAFVAFSAVVGRMTPIEFQEQKTSIYQKLKRKIGGEAKRGRLGPGYHRRRDGLEESFNERSPHGSTSPEASAEGVQRAIHRLKPGSRRLIDDLRSGLKAREIAERDAVSAVTVRKRVQRARADLRRFL